MEKFNEKYGRLVNDLLKRVVGVEEKSFDEIVSSYDTIIAKFFQDDVYTDDQWITVELFAQRLAERAAQIYATRLGVAFENCLREVSEQSFYCWLRQQK